MGRQAQSGCQSASERNTIVHRPFWRHPPRLMKPQAIVPNVGTDLNRRNFLKQSSTATLAASLVGAAISGHESRAADAAAPAKKSADPVNIGVIGCGAWGRDVVKTLAELPTANLIGVAEPYAAFLKRAKDSAPKAEGYADYAKLLENKDIKSVVIATPTHQHKQVVLDALAAGKHVYCEAPLASNEEDVRAIAKAAQNSVGQVFQPGLQNRSDPQRHFLLQFIRSGAAGKIFKARAQWHKKDSWRRRSPNPDREKELNWRLDEAVSLGLAGEIGVQHLDTLAWFLKEDPIAITGYGAIHLWNDGRVTPDTIDLQVEYPERDHEVFYGSDSAVMVRKNKAWMFREADAPLLGWEVYARKDAFFGELGIALVANATKLVAQGEKPAEEAPYANTPLFYALEAFLYNSATTSTGVADFTENYDASDKKAMKEYLDSLHKSLMPAATLIDGFRATMLAIKAHEAVAKNQRVAISPDLFKV
jgi:predicted dehydrogenase